MRTTRATIATIQPRQEHPERAKEQGLPTALQDKLRRCHDLPTTQKSTLAERDDLDFTKATATSQLFHFDNCWVEVTKDGIVTHHYSAVIHHYVWEDSLVHHSYRPMEPMFEVEKTDNGYFVKVAENQPSKYFQFVINTSRLYWRKEEEDGLELTEAEGMEEHQCLVSKLACIGYLLHGYKSESSAWAPFCQDAAMGNGEDECNGRSGKSFFYKAIAQMLNNYPIEARVPSVVDNRFLFDGVNEDTDLIIVDECHRKLDSDIKAQDILNEFNKETGNKWSMTLMTRKLKAYCEFADHLQCLNPTCVTGKAKDGEPLVKRENGRQERYYHIQTVKATTTANNPTETTENQLELDF